MIANMGPPESSGRPLSPSWWVPGTVYAVSYTVGVMATAVALTFARAGGRFVGLEGVVSPGGCCCAITLESVLLCHLLPLVSDGWLHRVVLRPTPSWLVVTAAIATGGAAGMGYWGLSFVDHRGVQQVGLLVLFLGGPLPGILWLIRRRVPVFDRDYDDDMTAGRPDTAIDLHDLAATEAFGRRQPLVTHRGRPG